MTQQEQDIAIKVLGLSVTPKVPTAQDSLNAIVTGLKSLGDKGLGGAHAEAVNRNLAAVASTINAAVERNAVNAKIEAATAAKAALTQKAAEINAGLNAQK